MGKSNLALTNRETTQQQVFYFTVLLFVASLPFAEFMISILSGAVLLQALIFFKASSKRWNDRTFYLLASILGVYIVGCLFTNNTALALYELKKTAFWLVVPFGVALSPKLKKNQLMTILLVFISAVTLSSFISVARLFLESSTVEGNFRDAHFVSHISFSLQVILSVLILVYSLIEKPPVFRSIHPYYLVLWALWLIMFLVILKSMVGLFAFYFTLFALIFYLYQKIGREYSRGLFIAVFILLWVSPLIYIAKVASDFYIIKDVKPENGIAFTSNGKQYDFDFDNKKKENGYYLAWYLCEEELIRTWNSVSTIKYDEPDAKGYTIGGTLIRYMTGKGLKKDSAGVAALTERDIRNIENGMANPIFDRSIFSIYPRIYETIWEIDYYIQTGDPNGQSFSKRIEYSKAAINIIKENFFFGIGTGNWVREYEKSFIKINSKLNPSEYAGAHNQYLTYAVKFGIVGLAWVLFVLFYAISLKKQWRNPVLVLFFISVMLANFGESVLETHVGLIFFTLFFSLFLWHWPITDTEKPKSNI